MDLKVIAPYGWPIIMISNSILFQVMRIPDPKGYNGSMGIRWEYLPTTGILESRVSYFQDDVAPGYEIDVSSGFFQLLQGHETLKTWSYYVSTENILSPRVRSLVEFSATDTTAREWRYSVQGSVNIALSETWFLRPQGGYTEEDPEFEAWFVGLNVGMGSEPLAAPECRRTFLQRYRGN